MLTGSQRSNVPREPKRSSEFRRYRQALTVLYLGTAVAGVALLTVSVLKELMFGPPKAELPKAAISVDDPDPDELLECNESVRSLLERLGSRSCDLLTQPPGGGDAGEITSAWKEFSERWLEDYHAVGARCGFRELADTDMGAAYDRIAEVHGDLRTMRLKYRSLVLRFEDEQAAELARMRRALDQSERALRERVEGGR